MNLQNKAFGIVLRELRRKRRLTQETLSFDAEMARTYISLLELGQRSPTLDTMLSICRALKISLVDLAALVEEKMAELNDHDKH